jgi:hypothetical protein
MSDQVKYALAALAIAVLGFILGRVTVGTKTVEVPVRVEIPVIRNVELPARVETVRVWPSTPGHPRYLRDTVWRSDEWDEVVKYTSDPLDTILNIRAYIVGDERTDTLEAYGRINGTFEFYGEPLAKFNIRHLGVAPVVFWESRKASVINEGNRLGFWLGTGSRLSTGAYLQYGWLMLGYEVHPKENAGEIRAQIRILSF